MDVYRNCITKGAGEKHYRTAFHVTAAVVTIVLVATYVFFGDGSGFGATADLELVKNVSQMSA